MDGILRKLPIVTKDRSFGGISCILNYELILRPSWNFSDFYLVILSVLMSLWLRTALAHRCGSFSIAAKALSREEITKSETSVIKE